MIVISDKKTKIANNMSKKRQDSKISRKNLALWTGVSYGSIRRFEETGDISLDGFLRIAIFLGWTSEIYNLSTRPSYLDRNSSRLREYYSKEKYFLE